MVHSDILQNHSECHQDLYFAFVLANIHTEMAANRLLSDTYARHHLWAHLRFLFVHFSMHPSFKGVPEINPGSLHQCPQNLASQCWFQHRERLDDSRVANARYPFATDVPQA